MTNGVQIEEDGEPERSPAGRVVVVFLLLDRLEALVREIKLVGESLDVCVNGVLVQRGLARAAARVCFVDRWWRRLGRRVTDVRPVGNTHEDSDERKLVLLVFGHFWSLLTFFSETRNHQLSLGAGQATKEGNEQRVQAAA